MQKEKLADSLLKEAENKTKKVFQTGDVTDINVAQTLLETAHLKRAEETETAKATNDIKNGSINARWNTLLISQRMTDISVMSGQWTHLSIVFNATVD